MPPNSAACGTNNYVGIVPNKPFTAERVMHSVKRLANGKENTIELTEFVARDSAGRIRFEKHGSGTSADSVEGVTLFMRQGDQFVTSRPALGTIIMIFDYLGGKLIQVQPGLRIAFIREIPSPSRPKPCDHFYSLVLLAARSARRLPGMSVEDLGYKEIEGIQAQGLRTVNLGTEKDGDWNGKPIKVLETWTSDDLSAELVEVITNIKDGSEGRNSLRKIKSEEPDPALFEVPTGYKVNPTPAEMPFVPPRTPKNQ